MDSSQHHEPEIGIEREKLRVFFSTPEWHLSGVNVMTARLVKELCSQGYDARFLFTRPDGGMPPRDFMELCVPFNVIPTRRHVWSLAKEWQPLIDFLTEHSPCIFVPNYDFSAAVVSSVLPSKVGIVGAIRSDEPVYFDQMERLGRFWNKIVAVSVSLRDKAAARCPQLADKMVAIPNGVEAYIDPKRTSTRERPLRLIYSGRIANEQKRVRDLVLIAANLEIRGVDFVLDVVGDGPDFKSLGLAVDQAKLSKKVTLHGRVNENTLANLYSNADVFLLVSEYEGMPNSLLEAMSHGCVPVCSKTDTGASEVIEDGQNGFLVNVGDINSFVRAIEILQNHDDRMRLSSNAIGTVRSKYSISRMVEGWSELLTAVTKEIRQGAGGRQNETMRFRPGYDPASVIIAGLRIYIGAVRKRIRGIRRTQASVPG